MAAGMLLSLAFIAQVVVVDQRNGAR